jgi:hypothetical protein
MTDKMVFEVNDGNYCFPVRILLLIRMSEWSWEDKRILRFISWM